MLYVAEYKRRQAAPGVKITRRNFGRDRRYPITNGFRDQALIERGLVGRGKLRHRCELEIELRHDARIHRGAKAFFVVPAEDPARGEVHGVRRLVVMEQALSRVEHVVLPEPMIGEMLDHVFEIALLRLVGADVLGGIDRIELDLQPLVAGGEDSLSTLERMISL